MSKKFWRSINEPLFIPLVVVFKPWFVIAGILDKEGISWNTGATASLSIKSFDEMAQRQQQREYAQQRHLQRVAGTAGTSTQ